MLSSGCTVQQPILITERSEGETAQTTEVGLGVDPIVAAAVEELRTINGEVETLAKEIHELESAIASRGSSRVARAPPLALVK